MIGLAVSRHRQLNIRDIIPHRFFGRLELAVEPVSIAIVKIMKLRKNFNFVGFWKNVVPNTLDTLSRVLSDRGTTP